MAFDIRPGEAYTIRRKVLKFFGAAFHIYDPQGQVVGYCKQKAFKLKEDIRVYTDESCTTEMIVIKARSMIDFGAMYDVTLPDGSSVGSFRRKGLKSSFLRDHWLVFDGGGRQVAEVIEDGSFLAFARRYVDLVSLFSPQKFTIKKPDGSIVARYRQHFNLFVYRLSVAVERDDPDVDDLVILAGGCLLCAIEGRQSAG
ncbi:MAG: hypothetical protein IT438_10990 [Phycisphaerales bacterium]|nr:hypothetical protein [Phycisphaerales bacterium]